MGSAGILTLFAHGIGDAADLGVSAEVLLGGSAAAVVGTAALLSARSARQGLERRRGVAGTGPGVGTGADPAWLTTVLVGIGSVLFAAILVIAVLGAPTSALNPAPRLLFTGFWAGLIVIGSLLAGPVWRSANPLRAFAAGVARLSGDPGDATTRALPERLGVWPAAVGLLVFFWVAYALPPEPGVVRVFLGLYCLVMLAGATAYGQAWFDRADTFEAVSGILGRLSPLGRDDRNRLTVRGPRRGLLTMTIPPGLIMLIGVLIGANLFEAILDQGWWGQLRFEIGGGAPQLFDGLGLLAVAAAVTLVIAGACRQRPYLLPALIPVAAGYALAHELSPLLIDLQILAGQLSNPLAGTAEAVFAPEPSANFEIVPGWLGAGAQLAALVGGHVAAVVIAHDAATARFDLRGARAVQFPFRALLVASVVTVVALRFSAV